MASALMRDFVDYEEARTEGIKLAREVRSDVGLEFNTLFKRYSLRLLPKPENRYGSERRCEVLRAEDPL